jgi:hypothetical protein
MNTRRWVGDIIDFPDLNRGQRWEWGALTRMRQAQTELVRLINRYVNHYVFPTNLDGVRKARGWERIKE